VVAGATAVHAVASAVRRSVRSHAEAKAQTPPAEEPLKKEE
jgi:hypothetical protein